jgi:serine/threonine protein kinase
VKITAEQWKVLSGLLDAALDLPPEARESWLESLEERSPALKAELRELLRQAGAIETNDFLDTLPKFGEISSEAAPPAAPGLHIAAYVIEQEIGRGGMGIVWRAHRADGAVKRTVALKCPRADMLSAELVQRFLLERDILAQLEHPNIARLYDAGLTESGRPFIALEYVEGMPLDQYCDRHRLNIAERIALAQQVLGAVQYAHTRLVIHRDLKPSNILVTADGQVRLLDFGVAKLLPTHVLSDRAVTQIGGRAITPDYAAPEHITGGDITTATDVYSLGVVLYELLTSKRPYRLERGSAGEIEEAIVAADPIRPDRVSLAAADIEARSTSESKLRRTLGGDLATILLKALKKTPSERYATVDSLAQDLDRFQHRQPVRAQADTYIYRTRKFLARNKLGVAAGTAVVLAISVAAAGFAWEARRATQQRDRALIMASRSDAVSQFLEDLVTDAGQSEAPTNVADLLSRSEQLANLEYKDYPEHRAAILGMLGAYYSRTSNIAKALSLQEQALRMAEGTGDLELQDELHCDHAATNAVQRPEEAKQEINRVIARPGVEPIRVVECLGTSNLIARHMGDGPVARGDATRALSLLSQIRQPPPSMEPSLLAALAESEYYLGMSRESDRDFAAALSRYEAIGLGESFLAQAARNSWANSNFNVEPRVALQLLEASMQILQRNSPASPIPGNFLANRGSALERIGRYSEALPAYEKCITSAEAAHDIPSIVACQIGAAAVYRFQRNLAEAERRYSLAAHAGEAAQLPAAGMVMRRTLLERARLDLEKGSARSALDHANLGIGDLSNNPSMAGALLIRAECSLQLGLLESAMADAQQSLSVAQKMAGNKPYSYQVAGASLMVGRVLLAQGDRAGARRAVTAAVEHFSHTVDEQQFYLVSARHWLETTPP